MLAVRWKEMLFVRRKGTNFNEQAKSMFCKNFNSKSIRHANNEGTNVLPQYCYKTVHNPCNL